MRIRLLNGFTLIELLVCVGIIAILASLLFPALNKAKAKGKAILCASNIKQIGTALFVYAADNQGELPYYGAADYASMTYANSRGWMTLLCEGKYAQKHEKDTTNNSCKKLSLSCPVYDTTTDVLVSSSYRYNWMGPKESGYVTSRGGFSSAPNRFGLRQSQIRRPTQMILLLETCGYHRANVTAWEPVFNSNNAFCADAVGLRGIGAGSALTQHGKQSNYAFADGHVDAMLYSKMKTQFLACNPDDVPDDNFGSLCPNSL